MKYIEPLFRPPAEAESLIFQVAYGCPHNTCRFCGMYKTVKYRLRPEAEVLDEIRDAGRKYPDVRRIFLADGDVMAMPFERLVRILDEINRNFPRLARIDMYANGSSIMLKTVAQLRVMRERKVHTLYMGLEKTGPDDPVSEARTEAYYRKRPCSELCALAAGILEKYLDHEIP